MSMGGMGGGLSTGPAGGGGPSSSDTGYVTTGTGNKTFNIGGNPNITSGALTPALIVGALLLTVWLLKRRK